MAIDIHGITHIALECSSPTRMERYLRDTFGMQLLRVGYWKGEYVRVMGSPTHQLENPGFVHLYNRPFIPRGRMRYVAFGTRDRPMDDVVGELRARGYYDIDGEDIITAPQGLRIKLDSFTHPRPLPVHDPVTKMVEAEVDPDLPCMVRGIHHVAFDVPEPGPLVAWQTEVFDMGGRRSHDRRGELISIAFYEDDPRDVVDRIIGPTPFFLRRGLDRVHLNHIAFDMADADGAIAEIEARGSKVDLAQDAMIHGPEELWYQIDSRDTPFDIGHPANEPGVPLFPYRYR